MNINFELNNKYYISDDSNPCDCNYCKNYYNLIEIVYPKVFMYLTSLGINVLRPLELSSAEPDENNILQYCTCQYVVFGSCEKDYYHIINDVEFSCGMAHPSTSINEEHFVLDIYPIFLPMELSI